MNNQDCPIHPDDLPRISQMHADYLADEDGTLTSAAKLQDDAYRLGYQRAQQPTDWQPSGADYDHSIHTNPDAKSWADLFAATFPGLADKHELMITWFANAMMAMHDYLKAQQPQSAEAVAYVLTRDGEVCYEADDGIVISNTPGDETDLYKWQPVYFTTPQPSAGVATDAARDVLAERHRQISAEGWTPEHDDEHDMGSLASAAGCYAMYTLAYPTGDPHPNWPWDKAWWKPSQDGRRNLVKAGALILAEIERLDRLNGKEVGRG